MYGLPHFDKEKSLRLKICSHRSFDDFRVFAHPKIVIATPDSDVSAILHPDRGVLELFGRRCSIRRPS